VEEEVSISSIRWPNTGSAAEGAYLGVEGYNMLIRQFVHPNRCNPLNLSKKNKKRMGQMML
jgi:hypothetical protein